MSRDPEIRGGELLFTGTRVPVATLVDYLKHGRSVEDFLTGFPNVERWQVETVQFRGWKGMKNGGLLKAASADYDVLVTMDDN